jgi:hypothetical protein
MMTFSLKLRLVWLVSGSRASSSWLVIANELKSWLGSARYHNEPSRAEPSELTSFEFFVQPYSIGTTSDATNGRTRQALPKTSFAFHLSEVIPLGQVKQVNHRLQAREQAIEKEEIVE